MVSQLTALSLQGKPRTTLNVGTLSGGTGVNVLASHDQFGLDVRSNGPAELQMLTVRVEQTIAVAHQEDVHAEIESIGRRLASALLVEHTCVHLAMECIAK